MAVFQSQTTVTRFEDLLAPSGPHEGVISPAQDCLRIVAREASASPLPPPAGGAGGGVGRPRRRR
eukprot:9949556-Lingulodinium_polyedra.AAC.1